MNFATGNVNHAVFITAIVITAEGVVRTFITKKPGNLGNVLFGGWLLMLVLSVFDLIPGAQPIVGAIAGVALFASILMFLSDTNIIGLLTPPKQAKG